MYLRLYLYLFADDWRCLGKLKDVMAENRDWKSVRGSRIHGKYFETTKTDRMMTRRVKGILQDWMGPEYHALTEVDIAMRRRNNGSGPYFPASRRSTGVA